MKNSEKFLLVVLIGLAVTGLFVKGFAGGVMTGGAAILIILSTVGRRQANRAATRIDKKMKDFYTQKNISDGNETS